MIQHSSRHNTAWAAGHGLVPAAVQSWRSSSLGGFRLADPLLHRTPSPQALCCCSCAATGRFAFQLNCCRVHCAALDSPLAVAAADLPRGWTSSPLTLLLPCNLSVGVHGCPSPYPLTSSHPSVDRPLTSLPRSGHLHRTCLVKLQTSLGSRLFCRLLLRRARNSTIARTRRPVLPRCCSVNIIAIVLRACFLHLTTPDPKLTRHIAPRALQVSRIEREEEGEESAREGEPGPPRNPATLRRTETSPRPSRSSLAVTNTSAIGPRHLRRRPPSLVHTHHGQLEVH